MWSGWSPPSEPVLHAVRLPEPHTGDALVLNLDEDCAEGRVHLRWQPFRTAAGLERLEYKIFAVAEGLLAQGDGCDICEAGCVTVVHPMAPPSCVQWSGVSGMPPGVAYRFFVCARYISLPLEALAPPPEGGPRRGPARFGVGPFQAGLWSAPVLPSVTSQQAP
ncbi:unnamed protein product, partial [Prorocentrum cordatum]